MVLNLAKLVHGSDLLQETRSCHSPIFLRMLRTHCVPKVFSSPPFWLPVLVNGWKNFLGIHALWYIVHAIRCLSAMMRRTKLCKKKFHHVGIVPCPLLPLLSPRSHPRILFLPQKKGGGEGYITTQSLPGRPLPTRGTRGVSAMKTWKEDIPPGEGTPGTTSLLEECRTVVGYPNTTHA